MSGSFRHVFNYPVLKPIVAGEQEDFRLRKFKYVFAFCLLLPLGSIQAQPVSVTCTHLLDQPDAIACVGQGNGLQDISYLSKGLHLVGRAGNGLEFFMRIFKAGQKAVQLCTGQYEEATNWMAQSLIYNIYEVCDHATETFDISVRGYISDLINQASLLLGSASYYATGLYRFGYLAMAIRTDIRDFHLERGRSTRQTIMNAFLIGVTFLNIGNMIYEVMPPLKSSVEYDEI